MTTEEAVRALDAIDTDAESGHIEGDNILVAVVPEEVAAAYDRAARRCGGWWYA